MPMIKDSSGSFVEGGLLDLSSYLKTFLTRQTSQRGAKRDGSGLLYSSVGCDAVPSEEPVLREV